MDSSRCAATRYEPPGFVDGRRSDDHLLSNALGEATTTMPSSSCPCSQSTALGRSFPGAQNGESVKTTEDDPNCWAVGFFGLPRRRLLSRVLLALLPRALDRYNPRDPCKACGHSPRDPRQPMTKDAGESYPQVSLLDPPPPPDDLPVPGAPLAWISTDRNSPKISAHRGQCLTSSSAAARRSTRAP